MKFCLLIVIFIFTINNAQIITQTNLSSTIQDSLTNNTSKYYSVLIPPDTPQNNILIITVDSHDYYIRPQIFVSALQQYPQYNNSEIGCYSHSLNACTRTNLTANSTIYFSVYCYSNCNYTLLVQINSVISIQPFRNYSVLFYETSSAILELQLDKNYTEYYILIQQSNVNIFSSFDLYLGIDYVPGAQKYTQQGMDLGISRKIIKIRNIQGLSNDSKYYILIQGQTNSSFHFKTYGKQTQDNLLKLNSTIIDIANTNQTYYINQTISLQQIPDPIYINLRALRGYGIIYITYCQNISFKYQDISGQNAQLIISRIDRINCQNTLLNNQIDLIESIQITVVPLYSTYGFSLNINEGNFQNIVSLNQRIFGQISQFENIKNYTLDLDNIKQKTNITIQIDTYSGDPVFLLSTCFNNQTCTPILFFGKLNYLYDPTLCRVNCSLQLTVSTSAQTTDDRSTYGFIFRLNKFHTRLSEGFSSDIRTIQMGQHIFYNISLLNYTTVTSITIKFTPISGSVTMLTSQNFTSPTFTDLFQGRTDIKYVWGGSVTYYDNLTHPIYVSLFGQSQAKYLLTININKNENVPSLYQLLAEEANNDFIIDGNPLLLKYLPHSIPYSISFYPNPSCISYGTDLPLNNTCMPIPHQFSSPVFINITGNQPGIQMRIIVNSGRFNLIKNQPILITCHNKCYEVITVFVNQTQRIMHEGYGTIINNQTKEEVSNGIMNITCKTGEKTCQKTILASLDWSGNMIIYLQSDDLTQISTYSQSVTLTKLPHRFYYRLPKNIPTVITVDSKGAAIDIYLNVEVMNQNYINLMQLQYPTNRIYDLKQLADPFRRVYMIQIEKQILLELGCFNENIFCIATLSIYLNTTYQYSDEFIKNGFIFVSASSYTHNLRENVPYRMDSVNSIQYFEFTSSQPKNLTFIIQPISNCNPRMLYSNKSYVFPTVNDFTEESYERLSLKNLINAIVGVVVQEQCIYDMVLLTNTNNYRFMLEGFPQTIQIKPNSTEYLLYNARNSLPFEIDSIFKFEIYANVVPYNQNASLYLPSKNNSKYSSKIPPLLINSTQTANYIIALTNTYNYKVSSDVIIKEQGKTVILLHNMLYKDECISGQVNSYLYYTANSFYIYFINQGGNFNISVTNSQNFNKNFFFTNANSNPWLQINTNGIFLPYQIQVISINGGKYTLEIVQMGSEGRPSLMPGLPFFDTFATFPQVNCYKAIGDPTIKKPLTLAFMYSQSYIQSLVSNNIDIYTVEPEFYFHFQWLGTKGKLEPKLLNINQFSQGVSYQIQQQYGTYTFCFENKNKQSLFKEYDVILSSAQLSYLIPSVPSFRQTSNGLVYEKYQTFTTQKSTIVIQINTCQGKTQLTGATKYSDILSGQTTQITKYQIHGNYYIGMVNISRGYYYLGVKTLKAYTDYIINTYIYPVSDQITMSNWELPELNLKWHLQPHNLIVTIVPLKTLNKKYQSQKLQLYTLYISQNLTSLKLKSNCEIIDKQKSVLTYKQLRQPNQTGTVTFTIPLKSLPKNFSMTAKAQVQTYQHSVSRTIPYYYTYTQQLLTQNLRNQSTQISWTIIIVLILIIVLVLLTLLACTLKKLKIGWFKPKQTVPFELAELNPNSRRQYAAEQTKKEERDSAPAYGEFVDESKL